MRAEYKRDMNHNYLILHGEEEIDTASYQVRMLVGNKIPTLLKCRVQGLDGNFMVYYDITSLQSVASLYEDKKFKTEDLRLIFNGFIQVMEDMSEYLLNPGNLVIRPEYLYLDIEKKTMAFCYLPGALDDVRQQFRTLTEYILPKLDHEDEGAVMLGYGVYRRALEDSFHLEHVKEELYQMREHISGRGKEPDKMFPPSEDFTPKQAKIPASESAVSKTVPSGAMGPDSTISQSDEETPTPLFRRGESGSRDKKQKAEKISDLWKTILGFGVAILGFAGVLGAKFLGYLTFLSTGGILGAVLILMAVMMLFWTFKKKHGAKNKGKTLKSDEHQSSPLPDRYWENREEEQIREREECGKGKKEYSEENEASYEKNEEFGQNFGETVVLSANPVTGPASLVSREPGELAAIYLQEELTVIGKLETAADAVINLPTVSRVHAKIRKREGEYYLSDLNSRNGTSVNGKMLKGGEECLLQDQDEVDFAQARYVFLK